MLFVSNDFTVIFLQCISYLYKHVFKINIILVLLLLNKRSRRCVNVGLYYIVEVIFILRPLTIFVRICSVLSVLISLQVTFRTYKKKFLEKLYTIPIYTQRAARDLNLCGRIYGCKLNKIHPNPLGIHKQGKQVKLQRMLPDKLIGD